MLILPNNDLDGEGDFEVRKGFLGKLFKFSLFFSGLDYKLRNGIIN